MVIKMQEKTTVCQILTEEGADPAMLEQYRRYQETGNIQGQCGLICRFRREKNEELKKGKEQLACLDYMIAKVENADERDHLSGNRYGKNFWGDNRFTGNQPETV